MSRLLAALERLPSVEALKAERERTGEGLMDIKARHQKAAVLQAIAEVRDMDDVKIILARIVEQAL